MKKKIVGCIIGRPGSGKGYVSNFLREQYGVKVVSMSEILSRSRDKTVSNGGEKIGEIMDRGEIVPARTVISLLEEEIESTEESPLLIEGFPRTIEQASFLETQQNGFKAVAFYLKAKRKLCTGRILNSSDRGKRADDRPEKIDIRQDIFERDTLPVIKYLETGNDAVPVVILDGRRSRDANAYLIKKVLLNF